MEYAEIKTKSQAELKEMLVSYRKEQFNLRFQEATGAMENFNRVRQIRKDIARVLTVLHAAPAAEKPAAKPVKTAKKGAKG